MDGQLSIFDFPEFLPDGKDKRKAEIKRENEGDVISPAQEYYISTGKTDYWRASDGKQYRFWENQCKIDSNRPCNRENLTEIAHDLGMKCEAKCCAGCPEKKMCGAACGQSHNY